MLDHVDSPKTTGFSNQTGGIVDTTENEQKCEELENIARLPRVLLIVWPRKRTG